MLRWSAHATDQPVELATLADGASGVGVVLGDELVRFASACAGSDDAELVAARAALVAAGDEALMVDAAAVAANFEMMTRLADGTGAAMSEARLDELSSEIAVMGLCRPGGPG